MATYVYDESIDLFPDTRRGVGFEALVRDGIPYVLEASAGVCLSILDDDHGSLVCFLYDYVIAFAESF